MVGATHKVFGTAFLREKIAKERKLKSGTIYISLRNCLLQITLYWPLHYKRCSKYLIGSIKD